MIILGESVGDEIWNDIVSVVLISVEIECMNGLCDILVMVR